MTKEIKVLKCLLSSELPEHIRFDGIIDRDDIVVSITKEMVAKAREEYQKLCEKSSDNEYIRKTMLSINNMHTIMEKYSADMIFLDDRSIDPDAEETRSFYYRSN